jgi:sugar O-acyltransferase (sialic acid O-acetyltransferase NeuD family)
MKNIAIYGAGGFGKEVACILNKINEQVPTWHLIGYLDDGIEAETPISHFGKVLGGFDFLNIYPEPLSVVFAIGSPQIIKKIVSRISNNKIDFPNIIHPEVFFADPSSLTIGKGNVVVRACSFSCDVTIGDFNQLNSISSLAHDVKVGSYNVFMPLSRISGGAEIGDLNVFGIGSVVLQYVKVGSNTRIAPGSYVMRKTRDGFLYMGNPARKIDI